MICPKIGTITTSTCFIVKLHKWNTTVESRKFEALGTRAFVSKRMALISFSEFRIFDMQSESFDTCFLYVPNISVFQRGLHYFLSLNSDFFICKLNVSTHVFFMFLIYMISNNVLCETSKASYQPAHTRSLIRAFASRLNIL